ncbi:MAG: glycosyltransferase family 2 protein, partial [Chthoniobacteraceae bacterium]
CGYYVLNSCIHYEADIQTLFDKLRRVVPDSGRVVILYYSALWKPLASLATRLGLRSKLPEQNWVSHGDVTNLLNLSDFEVVRRDSKILCPVYIPVMSALLNHYLAPLPGFRLFNMVNIVVARPLPGSEQKVRPSVSVVVPTRNESGNIDNILRRCPKMGPDDELIFVEGNSTDDTWEKILEATKSYTGPLRVLATQQSGKGKGDAVRKGFSLATKEILMILDADLTVPPEDLPKFYGAIVAGKGEFINGSRLVYPMEKEAMRFFNILGNKFFATAFSFVLNEKLKDTLCGTKVLTRSNYLRLAANRSYFGEFDPFGDFDLIFGAARLGLKIVEIPIHYRERTYGDTNIQRWRHGSILLRMLIFAAQKIKFI